MNEGIKYYKEMFNSIGDTFVHTKASVGNSLNDAVISLNKMREQISILEKNQQ